MKKLSEDKKKMMITLAVIFAALLAAYIVSAFVVSLSVIHDSSMEPTLRDGDLVLISRLDDSYEIGDIVVFHKPELTGGYIVKRIAAKGGDTVGICDGAFSRNGRLAGHTGGDDMDITVPEGYLFLLGDNFDESVDSRSDAVGLVSEESVEGKVIFRFFPRMTNDFKLELE